MKFHFRALIPALLLFATLAASAPGQVRLGIDVLRAQNYAPLAGKRVGLITNQTGIDSNGVRTRLLLKQAPNVRLVALFTPEHGLDGTELAGKYVASRKDPVTGLIAHSLYGPTRKPTPEMLRGIDVLVYDMQDIGVRSYTYVSTMGRCMEAAGEQGIKFMVLDRPNPLGGLRVEGPMIEQRWISFVGQFPVPYVHGLTAGELARMSNARGWMAAKCDLTVIPMEGWARGMTWPQTGLRWIRTSPNIPRGTSPLYYVATGIAGSLSGLELGIGTAEPFELIAAPWSDADRMAARLRGAGFPGVEFVPLRGYEGSADGVRLRIDPAAPANLTGLAVHLLQEANRGARPSLFARSKRDTLDIFYKVYGSTSIRDQIEQGVPAEKIVASWRPGVENFRAARQPFLLYR
jgi:uncharacterized protein YbbC (DUF1343 family)